MEIIDMLNELEKKVLNGKRYFFLSQNETILQEKEILDYIENIRKVIDERYQILKNKLLDEEQPIIIPKKLNDNIGDDFEQNEEAKDIVSMAKTEAREIKEEIDSYADQVLQNLKLSVVKFKRKLAKMDEVIDICRDRLVKTAHYSEIEEE